jgi:hypothetical protein
VILGALVGQADRAEVLAGQAGAVLHRPRHRGVGDTAGKPDPEGDAARGQREPSGFHRKLLLPTAARPREMTQGGSPGTSA